MPPRFGLLCGKVAGEQGAIGWACRHDGAVIAPDEDAPQSGATSSCATIVENSSRDGFMVVADNELRPGELCGGYRVEALIGSGGFSRVYRATDLVSGETVAIKVLDRRFMGSEIEVRFLREARALQELGHPDILRILGFGCDTSRSFLVTEYLRGENLRQLLRNRGRFDAEETLALMTPVCRALAAAHAAGVVHRDVKTSNVFVLDGEPRRVRLLDFGVAKFLRPEFSQGNALTVQGERLGTPHSMSPEQIRGSDVDGRADIYALGVMLFQLLTGHWPFRGNVDELTALHLGASPPKPSEIVPVSSRLDLVVFRAMAKNRDERFQTVGAFLEAMEEAIGTQAAVTSPASSRAIAVYVETGGLDGESDATVDLVETAEILDTAERTLSEAGFQICATSGSTLLAAAVLPSDAEKALGLAWRTRDLARSLAVEAHEGRLRVRVHLDGAEVVESGRSQTIVGGRILMLDVWPALDTSMLAVSEAVGELLRPEFEAPTRTC